MVENRITVISVGVVTYNHRSFIERALSSVLSQDIDEPIEIVVADDASTDGTTDIVREFGLRNPAVVRPLLSPANIGPLKNGRRVREACTGEYLAILEGDDYWTSNDKLSRQLAYLRAHRECVLCFHPVIYVDALGEPTGAACSTDLPDQLTLRDFLAHPGTPIHINSVLFRSSALARPAWIDGLQMGDWPTLILALRQGKAGRLPDAMSAYRIHEGGLWSGRDYAERNRAHLQAIRVMRDKIGSGFEREIDRIEYFFLWRLLEYAQAERAHRLAYQLAVDLVRLAENGVERRRWLKTVAREGLLAFSERLGSLSHLGSAKSGRGTDE